jgi:hypothetical protein
LGRSVGPVFTPAPKRGGGHTLSRSIDLFIDSELPLQEVAAEISRITGLAAAECVEREEWALVNSELEARLAVHQFLDDGDLVFERYRYCLSVTAFDSPSPADSSEAALLRLVLDLLRRQGVPCLLVFDLQYRDPATEGREPRARGGGQR